MPLSHQEIKDLLDQSYMEYNQPGFIPDDPISIPHQFTGKEDIEIAGFFAAILAWGNRATIIRNANKILKWMDHDPSGFIRGFQEKDLKPFVGFVHRTFNGEDCLFFLHALKNIYLNHGGLEKSFSPDSDKDEIKTGITNFRNLFFELPHLRRTEKHIANPKKGSSAKRINMFLRWMVRKNNRGVDFGIWTSIASSRLMCPLDVHTGTVSRKLGLLDRKQDDWKAVEELTNNLRKFDQEDPVKYDLALFGLGVNRRI